MSGRVRPIFGKFEFRLVTFEPSTNTSLSLTVFAVTAANDHESSWSCYYDNKRKTSLADSFSINWMRDSEIVRMDLYRVFKKFAPFPHFRDEIKGWVKIDGLPGPIPPFPIPV